MVLPMNPHRLLYYRDRITVVGAAKSATVLLLLLPLFMAPRNSGSFATALDPQSEEVQVPPSTVAEGRPYRDDTVDPTGYNTTNDADTEDSALPSEIQKAVCTVTAGEVRASAEAVTTKTLKGVCGSAELHLALSTLESKLYQELHEIKMLLQRLSQQNDGGSFKMPAQSASPTIATLSAAIPATTVTTSPAATNLKFQPIFETRENAVSDKSVQTHAADTGLQSAVTLPKLKSLSGAADARPKPMITHRREQEVSKFNNTMLTDRDFKVFTYYWKLENFTERIECGVSATVESPTFSIKGKALHIKAYFQHLHRDLLYLQLAYAPTMQQGGSQRNNIILDMGGLFKEIHQSSDKVMFKHKITILDQNNKRSKDLVSQEFNNLDTGFFIPNSALLASPYVKNNSLLIQIFLYL